MRWLTAAGAILTSLALVATAFGAPASDEPEPTAEIVWQPCPDTPAVQCGTLEVPLDWAHPHGEAISLALARRPAEDPAHRVGSLLFNPGGPGGAGVAWVERLPETFSPTLRQRFDIVGFDPRGVGRSTPVRCDLPTFDPTVSLFPTDAAGFQRLVERNLALGQSCQRETGPLLGHVDTTSAPRDIEAIRVALGDGQLNWLGLSYGTMLGAAYAELYPRRIRAMALDGNLEHSLPETVMLANEVMATEDAFNRFTVWCGRDASCPLHGADVALVYDELVAAADLTPIPASTANRGVSGEEIRFTTQSYLLAKNPMVFSSGWVGLGAAIDQARNGDASGFVTPVSTGQSDNPQSSARAIECLDFPAQSRSFEDLLARVTMVRVLAPHTGGGTETWKFVSGCIGWPEPPQNLPHRARIKGAPPMLLVNASHDPSTAYVWALGLEAQIPGSTLLTRDGEGHTSYITSDCARAAIDRYLVDLGLPPPGTVCTD
jgi:pimeloyl-ACP methyl ester carboxylesterase